MPLIWFVFPLFWMMPAITLQIAFEKVEVMK